VRTVAQLGSELLRLDGRGYRAYKELGGSYRFPRFVLLLDHVQGDPFADPSRVRVQIEADETGLGPALTGTDAQRVAAADFLNRRLVAEFERRSASTGSGRSGELSVLRPAQEVLRRTSVTVAADGGVEARFRVGLPARGRRILGVAAVELLCHQLPDAVAAALFRESIDGPALRAHVETVEDARAIRGALVECRLIAFVGDGSILPRRSGVDDRPLSGPAVVPFRAPDSLRVTIQTPNSGPISGLAFPEGVTLLVGGGFHGKSTLLRAIERGVYDHVPGDGRERVVARSDVLKVRAEDGRAVAGTDISNFINDLPGGEDTARFTTENASGSTSQAASIAEALELDARCLLLDEDTSATNFLIRDARVQALIPAPDEPITPLIARIRDLRARNVSVIIVVGGSGDYFDVADTVIAMKGYVPFDVTEEAKRVAAALPTRRAVEPRAWHAPEARVPLPSRIDPRRGNRPIEVRAFAPHRVRFGAQELDLHALEQLVETAQLRAIARALAWARNRCIDGSTALPAALRCVMEALATDGLDTFDDRLLGEYAEFRIFELAGVLNRMRRG
jgi:predicted ABC-class ATPase